MDPRLKGWGSIALAGIALTAVLLLPGGDPIMSMPRFPHSWRDDTPAATRQFAVKEALGATKMQINLLKYDRGLAVALSDRRDPLVISSSGTAPSPFVATAQRAADSIWATLPARNGQVRTVLDIVRTGEMFGSSWVTPDGDCIIQLGMGWGRDEVADGLRQRGGECLLREVVGAPGPSWEKWLNSIPWRTFAWIGAAPTSFERYVSNNAEDRPRAWFELSGELFSAFLGSRTPPASPLQLAYAACSGGRPEYCQQAYQVNSGATLAADRTDGPWTSPNRKLPAALLADLGPVKFAELWRTELPISVAYEELAGRSIDPILTDLAGRASGRRLRETALPLLSWFGVIVWGGLLLLWARERVRGRVVG